MNPAMLKMLFTMLKIDESKLPKTEELAEVFARLKSVPDRLDALEKKIDALINSGHELIVTEGGNVALTRINTEHENA